MTDKFVIEEIVGEDGKIVLQLPPDAPHGHIRITVEAVQQLTAEEETALNDEYTNGLPTAIGIWADRTDIVDSVEYIENVRRENMRKRLNRD